jgi:hypothetical protein
MVLNENKRSESLTRQSQKSKEEYTVENIQAFPVDGISSLGIHNGVVRIQFMRLDPDGRAVPAVEINVPVSQMRSLADTLINSTTR